MSSSQDNCTAIEFKSSFCGEPDGVYCKQLPRQLSLRVVSVVNLTNRAVVSVCAW